MTRREGIYLVGETLFMSQTNRVNVNFVSDFSIRQTGFTLDLRSILYTERAREFSSTSIDLENITLNVLFVMTFLPQLKTWRNTSEKNMVDSSPVSRSYRPIDTGKKGWSKVNEERRRPKQRQGKPSTSRAGCVWKDSTQKENWTNT